MSQTRVIVFMANFGASPVRERAMRICLEHLSRQSIVPEVIIGNLSFGDDKKAVIPSFPFAQEVPIRKSSQYVGLFHKEAMYNFLVRRTPIKDDDTVVFLDADVYSIDVDWIKNIADACRSNPATIYQGFSEVTDTTEEDFHFNSVISAILKTGKTHGTNPGLCWAMSGKIIRNFGRDVFFADYVCGAGDTAFYQNYASNIPGELMTLNRFSRYLFELDQKFRQNTYNFSYVNVPIVHINHSSGKKNLAYYSLRSFAFDYFLKMTGDGSIFDRRILRDKEGFFYFSDLPLNEKFQKLLKDITTFTDLDSLAAGMGSYFTDETVPKVTAFLSDFDSHTFIGVWKRLDAFFSSISQNFFKTLGMIYPLEEADYVLLLCPDIILNADLRAHVKALETSDFVVFRADIIPTASHPFLNHRDHLESIASMPGALLFKKKTYLNYKSLFDGYFSNKDRDFEDFLNNLPPELSSHEVNKCGFIVFRL